MFSCFLGRGTHRVPTGRAHSTGRRAPTAAGAARPRARDLERLAAILLETGEVLPEANGGKPLRAGADGHRDDRRRGLPIIGRGTTGAIPGTSPSAPLSGRTTEGAVRESSRAGATPHATVPTASPGEPVRHGRPRRDAIRE